MNLHSVVSGAISAINPHVTVVFKGSKGYTTDGSGERTPLYEFPQEVQAQIQDLSQRDMHQLDGLNITGSSTKIYLYGIVSSVVRVSRKGGDLILYEGRTYLTTAVLEQWPDWCAVSATLQND